MGLSKVLDETETETLSDAIKDKLGSYLNVLQTRADEFKSKYEKACVNSGKAFVKMFSMLTPPTK